MAEPEPRVLARPGKGETKEEFKRRVLTALVGAEKAEEVLGPAPEADNQPEA